MDRNTRILIESIKKAKSVKLVVESDDGCSCSISCTPSRKLHHDIAIAYQQAVRDAENNGRVIDELRYELHTIRSEFKAVTGYDFKECL